LVRGGGEVLIPTPAFAAARYHKPVARRGEIVQQLTGFVVINQRTHWNRNVDGRAIAARAIAAFSMPPALGGVLGIKTEVQQGVVMFARDKHHIAAAAAIAAARSAARDKLLAPERKTAVAAVARLHADSYFINKHWYWAGLSPQASIAGRFSCSPDRY
jgi:hypothetical protein